LLFVALTLLIGCVPANITQVVAEKEQIPTLPLDGKGKCGDGICKGPENSQNCLKDCPGLHPSSSEKPAVVSSSSVSSGEAPLFLTTMTHMESNFTDDRDQAVFLRHIELPFAIACEKWGLNMLQEALDRGMGVGTHSDLGLKDNFSIDQFARELVDRKEAVDRLVGAENNRGTSGAGSHPGWLSVYGWYCWHALSFHADGKQAKSRVDR
jgi:hypothetical protein